MKKAMCIISNVLMSSFYISTSWMVSAAALFYLIALDWDWTSLAQAIWIVATTSIALTPIFCLLGIILSIVKLIKERYLGAFLWQFLPFGTLGLSVLFFLLPVWISNLIL